MGGPSSFELPELRVYAASGAKRVAVHLELGLGHLQRLQRPGAWKVEARQILEHLKAHLIVNRARTEAPPPPRTDTIVKEFLLNRKKPPKRTGAPEKGRAVRVGKFDVSVAGIPPVLRRPMRNTLWRPEREEFEEGEVRVTMLVPRNVFAPSKEFGDSCRRAARLLGDVVEALDEGQGPEAAGPGRA